MEYFLDVVKNKYAEFNGRARRKEYWMFTLFYLIFYFGLSFLTLISEFLAFLPMILSLGLFIPSIAVGVRRMHDVDKSGWFILIPIYNLILACTEGTRGPNQYGPDPKGGDEISDIGKDDLV